MSTIFPGSASVGQVYNNYTFDGTAWNINGIDLTENYLEESSASAIYLTQVNASATYATIEYVESSISNSGGGSSRIIRHDWVSPYDYIATAPTGTLESSNIWSITRIEIFADGTTSTTKSTDSWDNRITAVYS